MSIVKGETSPGDPAKAGLNLQQKWSRQTASLAKQCRDSPNLKCVLASATLSKGVIQLSAPIMSAGELLLVDADRSQVGDAHINSASVQSLQSGALPDFTFRTNAAPGDSSNSEEVEDVEPAGKKVKVTGTTLDKGEAIETPSQLSQYFMMVTCKWRLAALLSFLRTHSHQKVVVFFSTCDSVDYHALLLHQMDWPVELDAPLEFKDNSTKLTKDHAGSSEGCKTNGTLYQGGKRAVVSETVQPLGTTFTGVLGSTKMYRLHGNVPQRVRQSVYKDFCAASSGVLLCTDVAARGLDLPKVDWILQYDPPCDTADYVHRVGRTARKGLVGAALLFLLPTEVMYLTLLASHSLHPEALSLQSLFEEAARLHNPGALKFRNTDEMHAVILQRRVEGVLYRNKVLLSAAKQAFRSVRPSLRHCLIVYLFQLSLKYRQHNISTAFLHLFVVSWINV